MGTYAAGDRRWLRSADPPGRRADLTSPLPLSRPADAWDLPRLPAEGRASALRQWLEQVDAIFNQAFHRQVDISAIVHGRSDAMDLLIKDLWRRHCGELDEVALLAVGGYGRGELHPYSDIDLLMLTPRKEPAQLKSCISTFVTTLWDLRLDVGHSVRSRSQCVQAASDDVSTATTLMETRLLAGPAAAAERLESAITARKVWPGKRYFKAKLNEQRERHKRYGGTAYNLEPNVKEGPGGLRDVQMVGWVAKRHYGAETLHDVTPLGLLSEDEYQSLTQARHYLWRVRYGLHLAAGRKENRLLFDHQRSLAAEFGFEDGETLAVEQFMQDYFRRVMQLERLNERLLQAFAEDILEPRRSTVVVIDEHFQSRNGYLEFRAEDPLPEHPILLLDLFRVLQENPDLKGVRSATLRQLRGQRELIDDDFRQSEEARRIFGNLWRDGRRLPEILERMHRYEVLDAYLPVFRKIVGRMQFDLFHVYTVDQHTLQVMKFVQRFAARRDDPDYPMAHDIFGHLAKPELLYLAAFFHDIAKGRGGDHSELGQVDALAFCQSHGFTEKEAQLVGWLVQHHLLMSMTAQRRDIGDPEVVNDFARVVVSKARLDYLYLLTLADISGTSIKLWNSWKARLLRQLYLSTRAALRRDDPVERSETIAATRSEARQRLVDDGVEPALIDQLWQPFTDEYFLRHSVDQVVWHSTALLARASLEAPLIAFRNAADSGAAELFVYAPNIEGTFATIVHCLGRSGVNVVDARGIGTTHGQVMDSFQVLDASGSGHLDESSIRRLTDRLETGLAQLPLQGFTASPQRLPERLKPFQKRASIRFHQASEERLTVMELIGSDRPGLLALIAGVLMQLRIRIHGVRVVTLGDRVEDAFLLSDQENRPLSDELSGQLETALHEALEQ